MKQSIPSSPAIAPAYSLEHIKKMRLEKRQEIRQSARRMQLISEALFAPQKSATRMEGLLQHVNAGIAAYEGVMTGLKILRRVQGFFRRKKR